MLKELIKSTWIFVGAIGTVSAQSLIEGVEYEIHTTSCLTAGRVRVLTSQDIPVDDGPSTLTDAGGTAAERFRIVKHPTQNKYRIINVANERALSSVGDACNSARQELRGFSAHYRELNEDDPHQYWTLSEIRGGINPAYQLLNFQNSALYAGGRRAQQDMILHSDIGNMKNKVTPNGTFTFYPSPIAYGEVLRRFRAESEEKARLNRVLEEKDIAFLELQQKETAQQQRIETLEQLRLEHEKEIAALRARLEEAEQWRSFIGATLCQREANHTPVRQRADSANGGQPADAKPSPRRTQSPGIRRAQSPGRRVQFHDPA